MGGRIMELTMARFVREAYESEIEEITGKKVRNCFFLVSGLNGKDYYVFNGNNKSILGICEILDLGTEYESHRWI